MTKDEVVKLAIKSGLIKRHDCEEWLCNTGNIETFAKLIAQHERKACLKLAQKYSENWTVDAIKARESLKQLNTEETV